MTQENKTTFLSESERKILFQNLKIGLYKALATQGNLTDEELFDFLEKTKYTQIAEGGNIVV